MSMLRRAIKKLFRVEAKGTFYEFSLFGRRKLFSKKLALKEASRNQKHSSQEVAEIRSSLERLIKLEIARSEEVTSVIERTSSIESQMKNVSSSLNAVSKKVSSIDSKQSQIEKKQREQIIKATKVLQEYSRLNNAKTAKHRIYAASEGNGISGKTRAILVADNRNRENWGCRGTSMELSMLVWEHLEIVHTITGRYTLSEKAVKHEFVHDGEAFNDFVDEDFSLAVEKLMSAIPNNPFLEELNILDVDFDVLIINGEGTMIFSTPARRDTLVYLMLAWWAQSLGKRVLFTNAMFSDGTDSDRNEEMIALASTVLGCCDVVIARDKHSFAYIQENLKIENASYIPDALFELIEDRYLGERPIVPNTRYMMPFGWENDKQMKGFDLSKPYICVTGGSAAAHDKEKAAASYINLVTVMKERINLPICLVQTCVGDRFLEEVADATDTPIIPSDVPLLAGASVLANATVFVGGRYHPSIMASAGGTPCVFFASNSHKTLSLQFTLGYKNPHEYKAFPDETEFADLIAEIGKLCNDAACRDRIRARCWELCTEAKDGYGELFGSYAKEMIAERSYMPQGFEEAKIH